MTPLGPAHARQWAHRTNGAGTPLSLAHHIHSVRRAIDLLELHSVAVVGHDSGRQRARRSPAGDERLRALVPIDTEQSTGSNWKFTTFLASRWAPGCGPALGWLAWGPTPAPQPARLR